MYIYLDLKYFCCNLLGLYMTGYPIRELEDSRKRIFGMGWLGLEQEWQYGREVTRHKVLLDVSRFTSRGRGRRIKADMKNI